MASGFSCPTGHSVIRKAAKFACYISQQKTFRTLVIVLALHGYYLTYSFNYIYCIISGISDVLPLPLVSFLPVFICFHPYTPSHGVVIDWLIGLIFLPCKEINTWTVYIKVIYL